jgi:hypothetical protein
MIPEIMGSLDCITVSMSVKKKITPLILEAVADYTLWMWHCCFNHPGSLNDINVWA